MKTLNDISQVCAHIAAFCANKSHVIFLLQGEIGAGKTFLVSQYAKFIDARESVTSPTFNIMHQYGENFFHYDLFNRNLGDLLELGLLDLLSARGIHFVEWGSDELFDILSNAFSYVTIIAIKEREGARIYNIS